MPRNPDPVDPFRSPRHLLGAFLRSWRDRVTGATLEDIAGKIHVNMSHVAKWERGDRPIPPRMIQAIEQAYDTGMLFPAIYELIANHGKDSSAERGTPGFVPIVQHESVIPHDGDMDVVRRRIFAGLAALGLAGPASELLDGAGRVGGVVDDIAGMDGLRELVDDGLASSRLSEWEETGWEYAHRLRERPDLAADLARDLLAVQRLMRSAPLAEAQGWAGVNARLAFMLAYSLGNVGHTRQSHRWWSTARRAAAHAGDSRLLAAANATEAVQALYEKRPLRVVMARVNDAHSAARGEACHATVKAHGARAHALVVAGDQEGACRALEDQARVFDRLPDEVAEDTSIFGWPVERLLHTRSLVYTLAGHAQAGTARRQALSAYRDPGVSAWGRRQMAQVQLHEAVSTVRSGDLVAGIGQARAVLAGLGSSDRTKYVRHVAGAVLGAVPVGEMSRPPAVDYREHLALSLDEGA